MIPFLLLVCLFVPAVQQSQPAESQARFVYRRDLPTDLNLPFRENGFTVVAVTFVNKSTQTVKLDTASLRVLDPKNKPLTAASSSEVTPKMVKSGARLPSASTSAPPPIYVPGQRYPRETGVTLDGSGGGGVIDIGRVDRLKAAIEKYQLKSADVPPGGKAEGYLYLKTDRDPDKLKGTRIVLTEEVTLAVE